MKKSSLLMIASMILLTACGTASQYAASSGGARFEDGIYSSAPSFMSKEDKEESRKETESLIEKTRASQIYLYGDKKDTVMIPENMSASIRYDKGMGGTVVTVGENPYDWQNYIDPWNFYTPYSIGSPWYWSRHYNPWYSSSWYWSTWACTPWIYSGWHDPFYWGGWYDPWYYGYAGWYGGWDPYWDHYYYHHHHHHHGTVTTVNRYGTGSRRQATGERIHGGSGTRRGTALASRAGSELRKTSLSTSGSGTISSRPVRVATAVRPNTSESSRTPAAARPVTARKPAAAKQPVTVQNYRKPVSVKGSASGTSSSGTAVRQPSTVSRPAVTSQRSDSSTGRSSSEYRSSRSSYSGGSSSYSGGSSRSSYSGGSTRSGGYSGVRR